MRPWRTAPGGSSWPDLLDRERTGRAVLERAGLITRSRNGQFRPCRLEADRLDLATAWIEQNRQIWSDRFDKLSAHLDDLTTVVRFVGSAYLPDAIPQDVAAGEIR